MSILIQDVGYTMCRQCDTSLVPEFSIFAQTLYFIGKNHLLNKEAEN